MPFCRAIPASSTPSRNIGTINPKGIHQADGIPGRLAQWHNRGRYDRRAPARTCSRACERAAAAGLWARPHGGCRAGRASAHASSVKAEIDKRNFAASRLRVNP